MADPKKAYGKAYGEIFLAFRASSAVYDPLNEKLGFKALAEGDLAKARFMAAADAGYKRLAVVYTKAGKNHTGSLWCAPDKVEEFSLETGGTYRGNPISRVYQPLDSSRH